MRSGGMPARMHTSPTMDETDQLAGPISRPGLPASSLSSAMPIIPSILYPPLFSLLRAGAIREHELQAELTIHADLDQATAGRHLGAGGFTLFFRHICGGVDFDQEAVALLAVVQPPVSQVRED